MRLRWAALDLPYRRGHFTISAAKSDRAQTLLLAAEDHGRLGLGEAAPSMRVTGQDSQQVVRHFEEAARALATVDVTATDSPPEHPFGGMKGPAACAVDGAILDLWARAHDAPLWRLLGMPRPRVPTSATISMGTPGSMADEARDHVREGFRILKVKLGASPDQDLPRLQAIREAAPRAVLRVDGNEGWSLDDAVALLPAFAEAGVELIEQPLPRDIAHDTLRRLTALCGDHEVAHVIDEGVHGPEDVQEIGRGRLAHGINLKLQKAGGLTNGLRVIQAAKDHGLGVMVGCFIETWAGIALALQPCAQVDWVDLDGAWLLGEEPVVSAGAPLLEDGILTAPDAPGLGVRPRDQTHSVFDEPTTSL